MLESSRKNITLLAKACLIWRLQLWCFPYVCAPPQLLPGLTRGLGSFSERVQLSSCCFLQFFRRQACAESPLLEHFDVNQDHVTVIDYRRRMFADVYFRDDRVYCALCGEEDCEHFKYALGLPKVQKALERDRETFRKAH